MRIRTHFRKHKMWRDKLITRWEINDFYDNLLDIDRRIEALSILHAIRPEYIKNKNLQFKRVYLWS